MSHTQAVGSTPSNSRSPQPLRSGSLQVPSVGALAVAVTPSSSAPAIHPTTTVAAARPLTDRAQALPSQSSGAQEMQMYLMMAQSLLSAGPQINQFIVALQSGKSAQIKAAIAQLPAELQQIIRAMPQMQQFIAAVQADQLDPALTAQIMICLPAIQAALECGPDLLKLIAVVQQKLALTEAINAAQKTQNQELLSQLQARLDQADQVAMGPIFNIVKKALAFAPAMAKSIQPLAKHFPDEILLASAALKVLSACKPQVEDSLLATQDFLTATQRQNKPAKLQAVVRIAQNALQAAPVVSKALSFVSQRLSPEHAAYKQIRLADLSAKLLTLTKDELSSVIDALLKSLTGQNRQEKMAAVRSLADNTFRGVAKIQQFLQTLPMDENTMMGIAFSAMALKLETEITAILSALDKQHYQHVVLRTMALPEPVRAVLFRLFHSDIFTKDEAEVIKQTTRQLTVEQLSELPRETIVWHLKQLATDALKHQLFAKTLLPALRNTSLALRQNSIGFLEAQDKVTLVRLHKDLQGQPSFTQLAAICREFVDLCEKIQNYKASAATPLAPPPQAHTSSVLGAQRGQCFQQVIADYRAALTAPNVQSEQPAKDALFYILRAEQPQLAEQLADSLRQAELAAVQTVAAKLTNIPRPSAPQTSATLESRSAVAMPTAPYEQTKAQCNAFAQALGAALVNKSSQQILAAVASEAGQAFIAMMSQKAPTIPNLVDKACAKLRSPTPADQENAFAFFSRLHGRAVAEIGAQPLPTSAAQPQLPTFAPVAVAQALTQDVDTLQNIRSGAIYFSYFLDPQTAKELANSCLNDLVHNPLDLPIAEAMARLQIVKNCLPRIESQNSDLFKMLNHNVSNLDFILNLTKALEQRDISSLKTTMSSPMGVAFLAARASANPHFSKSYETLLTALDDPKRADLAFADFATLRMRAIERFAKEEIEAQFSPHALQRANLSVFIAAISKLMDNPLDIDALNDAKDAHQFLKYFVDAAPDNIDRSPYQDMLLACRTAIDAALLLLQFTNATQGKGDMSYQIAMSEPGGQAFTAKMNTSNASFNRILQKLLASLGDTTKPEYQTALKGFARLLPHVQQYFAEKRNAAIAAVSTFQIRQAPAAPTVEQVLRDLQSCIAKKEDSTTILSHLQKFHPAIYDDFVKQSQANKARALDAIFSQPR